MWLVSSQMKPHGFHNDFFSLPFPLHFPCRPLKHPSNSVEHTFDARVAFSGISLAVWFCFFFSSFTFAFQASQLTGKCLSFHCADKVQWHSNFTLGINIGLKRWNNINEVEPNRHGDFPLSLLSRDGLWSSRSVEIALATLLAAFRHSTERDECQCRRNLWCSQ